MRVLVVSDIHGNLPALEAVLEDAGPLNYEAVWCLGDTVGYGPDPDECITRIRELEATVVLGNHDWATLGKMDVDDFNPEARRAVLWTREHIGGDNLAWLGALTSQPLLQDAFTLTHGSPRDPVWEYILHLSAAAANLEHFTTAFCLVGHTHIPAFYAWRERDGRPSAIILRAGQELVLQDYARGILNPGSVGQPRDNNPRAAYALLDTGALTWQSRRVAYPLEVTQARMRAAALPDRLINRLAYGW